MPDASTRLPWWRRWFGTRSERAAARYLKQQKYRIVARNYTCPLGELDLVAVDGRCVVFVEVRSSQREDPERPAASVDVRKQRRLTDLALHFLKRHRLLRHQARFDVVIVNWPEGANRPRVTHFRGAFEADGRFQFFS